MANTLSAASWKKFLGTCPGVEKPDSLAKALEKYDRIEAKGTAADRLAATIEVIDQAKAVEKKNPKNDKLEKHLGDLFKEANAAKAAAQADMKKEEEEGDGPEDNLKGMIKVAKKLKRDKAFEFVFAPAGKMGGLVVARRVSTTLVKKAWALREANLGKKVANKKRIDGICYGKADPGGEGDEAEDDLKGDIVFELPEEPKAGLAKAMMKTIMAQTGKRMKVTVKGPNTEVSDDLDIDEMEETDEEEAVGGEGEGEEGEGDGPRADPALVAEVGGLVKEVGALLDSLKAADAAKAPPFASRYAEALGHEGGGRYGVALTLLRELGPELREALGVAAGEADALKAEWDRRSSALVEGLKAAFQQKSEAARDLKFYYNEAMSLAKAGQYKNALGELEKVENLLKAIPKGAGVDPKDLVGRARALRARFDELSAGDAAVSRFEGDVAGAAEAARGGAPDALDRLEYAEGLLDSAARAAKAAREIAQGGPARTVGFRKAREDWDKARTIARAQMQKFEKAVVSDPEVQDLAEWPLIEQAAGMLVPMLDVFDGSLAQAVADAEDTDPETQRSGVELAAHLIREYRLELAENAVFGVMDSGGFGTFKVHDLLSRGLEQVASKLGV